MKVLAIVGSLRKGSYNKMLLQAAMELKPNDMQIESAEIGDIPPYNEDVREKGFPGQVQRLREQIRVADAILFVTPEYNYAIPGVLKNAIDWASRPPDQPFNDKPAAIMGASISRLGTARAQYHLRQSCVYLNMYPLNQPEVMVAEAAKHFDASGKFTDEGGRKLVSQQLLNLERWVHRLGKK
ncbi:MAG TPA: NADPH-dependent FMN reductase [Gammaproteobacteria bacterium]|nr:NADPH-dependent FMN reductase [Gammaproteobacteria bacterium]